VTRPWIVAALIILHPYESEVMIVYIPQSPASIFIPVEYCDAFCYRNEGDMLVFQLPDGRQILTTRIEWWYEIIDPFQVGWFQSNVEEANRCQEFW